MITRYRHSIKLIVLVSVLAALAAGVERSQAASALDEKAEALLAKMTLEEKIGQMTQADLSAVKDKADIAKYGFGSMLSGGGSDPAENTPKAWADAVDEVQQWALKTRLKIPLLYGVDAVHGHNNVIGAVVFPHNIGLGATRDPRLVERAARVTATEMAATGIRWAFAPCVAVARNPRWGRTYEAFGDRPELASLLGPAAVRGLQGASLAQGDSVLACPKHYLADGGTTDGIDQGNAEFDEATLRKIHLPGYIACIKAGGGSIMVSYSSWKGQKMHGHRYLLTDVLKKELGFKGFLVSDWAAIDQLGPDYKADVEASINAGLDMIMIPNGPGQKNSYVDFINDLKSLVGEGRVPQARIDDAVRRILRVKLQLGFFEDPQPVWPPLSVIGSPQHREVARECVRASLVVLKNSGGTLPLSKRLKHLHVVGKGAADMGMQCGGWTIDWQGKLGDITKGGTTILAGIQQAVGSATKVTYSATGEAAAGAEAIVVVVGEEPYAEMKGDRADLSLAPADVALVIRAKSAGVPVVTVLLSGRPLILGDALTASDALVAAWLPGSEGAGVADVLFGDFKPSGKLPCSWPASMEQVGRDPNALKDPLFKYGFGLTFRARKR